MKLRDVYDEVATSTVDDNVLREAIPTKWVHRKTGTGVRSRIVAKGYTEKIEDEDSVYASTPMFTTLRTLLALQMSQPNWVARLGDVSTAFLHAPIAKDNEGKQRDVYLWPPRELCPQQDKLWRLKKAMYGLRSSPKAWQDYLAEVLQKLGFVRLKSEPNVYTNAARDCYIITSATWNLASHNNSSAGTSSTSVTTALLDYRTLISTT